MSIHNGGGDEFVLIKKKPSTLNKQRGGKRSTSLRTPKNGRDTGNVSTKERNKSTRKIIIMTLGLLYSEVFTLLYLVVLNRHLMNQKLPPLLLL